MPHLPLNLLDHATLCAMLSDLGMAQYAASATTAELLKVLKDIETDGCKYCR